MKKFQRALIVILFALACALSLSGCFLMTKKDTITFYANGGVFENGKTSVSVKYEHGKQITSPPEPTRDGFTLLGWTDDINSQYQINFYNYKVSGDDDLYAVWTPADPTITFSSDFTEINDFYNEYRTVVDSNVTQFSFADKVTCTCDWEVCYEDGKTVYDLYPGDNYYTLQTVDEYGSQLRTYRVNVHRSRTVTIEYEIGYDTVHTVEVPSGYPYTVDSSVGANIEGRTVVGWRSGTKAVTEITPLNDVKLEAILEYSNYTVTYDANDGELSNDTATATYQSYLRLPYPQREGYTFLGWYDGEAKIGEGGANVRWTIIHDVTLVAKWEIKRVSITTVSALPAGGTVTGGGYYDYGTPLTLTATVNSGYTFLGWYDGNGNNATLLSNDLVFETTTPADRAYYYARYQKSRLSASANYGNVVLPDTTIVGKSCTVSTEYSSLLGFTFDGWYLSGRKVCDTPEYTFEMTAGDINLAAKWVNPELEIFDLDVTDTVCKINGLKPSAANTAHLVIPDAVTEIGRRAFYQNEKILTVTIGDGVTEIGERAFFGCTMLIGAYVGRGLETVGSNVFYDCHKLVELKNPTDINFGGNISPLHNYADGDSYIDFGADGFIFYIDEAASERILLGYTGSETSLVLPDDFAYTIYRYAFANSSTLAAVTVAPKTTAIGERAFYACQNLATINYGATNATVDRTAFGKANNTDAYKNVRVTIASNVTHIPDGMFNAPYQLNIIAVEYEQNSMCEYIGEKAFYSLSGITTITIPENVTFIGADAFNGCTGATNIDYNAIDCASVGLETPFDYAGKNAALNIGASVKSIPDYMFYAQYTNRRPNVASLTFEADDTLETIGARAFSNLTMLTNIIIPKSVTSIGAYAFAGCTDVIRIEYSAAALDVTDVSSLNIFSGACTSDGVAVTIGAEVKFIPDNLFKFMTKISSVAFAPNSTCESIGAYAFYRAGVDTKLDIPDNVTTIGERAFSDCNMIPTLTVGTGLKTVGTYAFANLNALTSLTWNAIAAGDDQNIFTAVNTPSDAGIALVIGKDVTKIPSRMFCADRLNQPKLSSIAFVNYDFYNPQSVEIGDYAFYGIESLKSVAVSWRVASIGTGAFSGCTGIESIVYAADLPDFTDNGAFENAGVAAGFTLSVDQKVTRIPANIFGATDPDKQTRVRSVSFPAPSACTEIGARAFYNCGDMLTVLLPDCITSIGEGAFGCSEETEINKVTIGRFVTSIGDGAFENRNITTINFNATNCNDFTLDHPCFTNCGTITFVANIERIPSYLTYSVRNKSFAENSICTEIGEGAFYKSRSSLLNLPNSVKKIGAYSFYDSSVGSTVFPSGVTEIGDYAFAKCTVMRMLNLSNVTKLGVGAFKDCTSLGDFSTVVDLSTKLEEIGEECFAGCLNIRSITLPASLKRIGARVFSGCYSALLSPTFADPSGWYANNAVIHEWELNTAAAAVKSLLNTYVDCELTHA